MKAIYHDQQRKHYSPIGNFNGIPRPNPEKPERIDALLAGAKSAGLESESPQDYGYKPIAAVHTVNYVQFLENVYTRWQQISGTAEEAIPSVHPNQNDTGYPKTVVAQLGYHSYDTDFCITADTFLSAYWSAQTAVHAAHQLIQGAPSAYALCRPPGHHAFADMAGGFCYFNNTAIAAQLLHEQGLRPAIIDVDLHHGNGTQHIFYRRNDVLTASIHADPERYYPFYWGYANELGEGIGLGYNLNLPIPTGTADEGFLEALEIATQRAKVFAPDILVVALGLDGFEGDPFAGLAISTNGFAKIGAVLRNLDLPVLIIQEGGYLCPELGDNLASFVSGISGEN